MNKKFSTLVASMLLATTVGTVSAQNLEFTKSALPTNVRVESVADGKCYQLTDGWNVLVMQKVSTEKGDRFILKYVPYYAANIGESLWYVTVDKDNKENGVAFKFMNLAYILSLLIRQRFRIINRERLMKVLIWLVKQSLGLG